MSDGPPSNDQRRTPADPRQTPGSAHFRAQRPHPTPSGRIPGQTPRTTPGMAGLPGAPPPDPTALGMWRVEAPIAKGGMGAVFRARHVQTGKAAAVKVILAGANATEAQRGRFTREVDALAALDHPGIVRVLDAGTWAGAPWFAMELVEGPDLSRAWPQLGPRERLQVVLGVAQAVGFAHSHGYVHRDLKPENVLLARDGAALRPLVTDFGLAKRVAGESRLTATGAVVGTPHHMAPEQVLGQGREAGPQADVWAVGTMLHQALFGRVPFDAEATLELFAQIVERPPPPLDQAAREACAAAEVDPEDVDLVRRRALAKEPLDRHASALELATDLERVLRGEAPVSQASGLVSSIARRARRNPRRALALLVAALATTVLLAVTVRVGRDVLRRRRAEDARAVRRLELGAALKVLERAVASPSPATLTAALEGADVAATASGAAPDPALAGELAELGAARRRARLLLCAMALTEESSDGAAWAAAAARAVEAEPEATPAERVAATLLGGRAAARLGDLARAEAAVGALTAAGDHAGAALVGGAAALAQGDAARALSLLEEPRAAPTAPDLVLEAVRATVEVEAALLRADALLRLERVDEARRALAGANEAPAARGLAARRGAHLLAAAAARLDLAGEVARARGEPSAPGAWAGPRPGDALADEAWRLAARATEESPGDDPRAARLLLFLARPLGRSAEARERLDAATRRAGAGPALRAVALLARLDAGPIAGSYAGGGPAGGGPKDAGQVAGALEDAAFERAGLEEARAGDGEARLRAADLDGLAGDPRAWDALVSDGVAPTSTAMATGAPWRGEVERAAAAARVRALAERGALDPARRALAALDAGPPAPADLPRRRSPPARSATQAGPGCSSATRPARRERRPARSWAARGTSTPPRSWPGPPTPSARRPSRRPGPGRGRRSTARSAAGSSSRAAPSCGSAPTSRRRPARSCARGSRATPGCGRRRSTSSARRGSAAAPRSRRAPTRSRGPRSWRTSSSRLRRPPRSSPTRAGSRSSSAWTSRTRPTAADGPWRWRRSGRGRGGSWRTCSSGPRPGPTRRSWAGRASRGSRRATASWPSCACARSGTRPRARSPGATVSGRSPAGPTSPCATCRRSSTRTAACGRGPTTAPAGRAAPTRGTSSPGSTGSSPATRGSCSSSRSGPTWPSWPPSPPAATATWRWRGGCAGRRSTRRATTSWACTSTSTRPRSTWLVASRRP